MIQVLARPTLSAKSLIQLSLFIYLTHIHTHSLSLFLSLSLSFKVTHQSWTQTAGGRGKSRFFVRDSNTIKVESFWQTLIMLLTSHLLSVFFGVSKIKKTAYTSAWHGKWPNRTFCATFSPFLTNAMAITVEWPWIIASVVL